MYYCNFPLSCIFFKSQVKYIYITPKADFDLQTASVIYTQCKADVIDDTEDLTSISPCSVQMRKNADQNNSEYGHLTVNQNLRVVNNNVA